jgi:UPF0271 protein
LNVAAEGFADRAYAPDGSLVPRRRSDSLITDADRMVSRAVRIVREQTVVASDGSILPLAVDTLCIHGDTPGAGELAARLRAGLESAGIPVRSVRL